ncbi:synaptotagmin-2-like isoform X2 [Hevea brasiliensis]|uniref:synaptotagmin-2-like isoform X2 n=1 Tax=Hevea brasiliensis TaxID=3981 RepID=UPI0025EFB21D|nr:synaptotagmin-2-like isoform X2 [Hevea brasiliensis]
MGILSCILGFCGFGVGTSVGIVIGYYVFIYFEPADVKDTVICPLVEQDSKTLQRLLPEIPLWVKNPDYDRVDWLNKFIETMWPCLDTAICKTARTIAKPIIGEQIPKYKIDSVEFEELTLGSMPPTFQEMKVYITDEKELIIEPSMKWAGNPNVIIAAKAFGLRATVQPRVEFGLKLLGADAMSIPGLYRFVQELIKDQVANMYLWPKALQVPVLDPAKCVFSPLLQVMTPILSLELTNCSKLDGATKRPVGILTVKVLSAMKLKKKDLLGASDPYVKLKLTEEKLPSKKTTVKHKNLNPEWNEEFNIVVTDPESQALEIIVYDWEQVGKHDKMGMNVVPLKELTLDEPKVMTLNLLKNMDPNDAENEKSRGQLVVELEYKPFKEDNTPNGVADPNAVERLLKEHLLVVVYLWLLCTKLKMLKENTIQILMFDYFSGGRREERSL